LSWRRTISTKIFCLSTSGSPADILVALRYRRRVPTEILVRHVRPPVEPQTSNVLDCCSRLPELTAGKWRAVCVRRNNGPRWRERPVLGTPYGERLFDCCIAGGENAMRATESHWRRRAEPAKTTPSP
jgi:hypothetical protein